MKNKTKLFLFTTYIGKKVGTPSLLIFPSYISHFPSISEKFRQSLCTPTSRPDELTFDHKQFKKCRENGLKGINWEEKGHYLTTFKGAIMLYNLTSSRRYENSLGQKIHEIHSALSLTASWTVWY